MPRRTFKPTMTEIILDILQDGAEAAADIFITMTSNYTESYRRARRGMQGEHAMEFKNSWSEIYRRQKNFYSLIQKLKRDGLIRKKKIGSGRNIPWLITDRGGERLNYLKKESEKNKWLNENRKSAGVIIVSYDIPESYRLERAWLREILKLFKFKPLHQSVWLGRTLLPKEFIRQLSQKKLTGYVEIFEVSKLGTISRLE